MREKRKVTVPALLLSLLVVVLVLAAGCGRQEKRPLLVYAGKGLKPAMDEIKAEFERRHGIPLSIIYAGSENLLATIQKTRTGDVFIPGTQPYLSAAGELVTYDRQVGEHIPAFAVRIDNPKHLETFSDLLSQDVRIALGNKDMCAIGVLAEEIINSCDQPEAFWKNVGITASTVNELLTLVVAGEVDAAMIWRDMLHWPEAKGLKLVEIPAAFNRPEEIRAAVMATSVAPKNAALFVDFLATEAKAVFARHGFGAE